MHDLLWFVLLLVGSPLLLMGGFRLGRKTGTGLKTKFIGATLAFTGIIGIVIILVFLPVVVGRMLQLGPNS